MKRASISKVLRFPRVGRRLITALSVLTVALMTIGADWPTYLGNGQRTSSADNDMVLNVGNAPLLQKAWGFATGGEVAASAAIVNSVAYVGSWNGYEYAIDARYGVPLWKTYLGQDNSFGTCRGVQPQGITSTATVRNGVLYVGGGNDYWYALNSTSGRILWQVNVGDNATGHYNWSSPGIVNGTAYVGVSSLGDCPLVQGQLLGINLKTHQITNTFNVVPNGQLGGGIWGSPAISQSAQYMYVATGNGGAANSSSQPYARALVTLPTSDPTPFGSWQVPDSQAPGTDYDFGSTPTLFSGSGGRPLIGLVNKNGFFYAFVRGNISSGPLWQTKIATGGEGPELDQGSIAPAAFGNGTLFVAGEATQINGVSCPGSVQALDPATGSVLWQHCAPGPVLGAVTYDNGLVIDAAGKTLEVLNAATGSPLFSYTILKPMYAAPSVSNGHIYEGSVNGTLYCFGLP
ncbi:MAG: hypothetical protein DLM70_02555 [Chloroflexi bacterium]|nr:MAG: hypothetical protein DLM70_02555 [Chloroflexota bacterium]